MSTLRQKTLHLFGVLIFAGQLQAASYILPDKSSVMGPEGLALGGALAGTRSRADFIHSNPASPAFEKKYTFGARYSTAGDLFGAQIVDTSSSDLGGAISYIKREFKNVATSEDASLGSFDRLENQASISLMVLIAEGVSLGLTGRYSYIRPRDGALPPQAWWSGDMGVLLELAPQWRLGLVGQDLLPEDRGYSYKSFALGLNGELSSQLSLLAQVDFVRDPEGNLDTGFVKDTPGPSFRTGLEFSVQNELLLRASYVSLTSWETSHVGFGLAYSKGKFSLDYGMRINPESSKSLIHALALSVDL